jgi:COP9 signalosome complex subunit 7
MFIDDVHRASTTSSVLATLDDKLAQLAAQTQESKDAKLAYTTSVDAILKDVLNKKANDKRGAAAGGSNSLRGALGGADARGGSRAAAEDAMMDVDSEEPTAKGKNRKGLFDFGAKGQRKRNRF